MQVWPGHRYPLGATYDGTGTNFAIFSEVAEAVEFFLFLDLIDELKKIEREISVDCGTT